jgi:drug/metabolite transporter (DMT)-like permease
MQHYSGIQVLRWIFTFGSLVILPFGMQDFISTNWSGFTTTAWMALAFIGIGATFLAYLLNVYGINIIGASATGAYIYTQPVFAAVIAVLVAGEKLSWIKLLAALLIFTGVYLANLKKKEV